MEWEFWAAVAAMGAITWLSRALPFLLRNDHRALRSISASGSPWRALGPCLIAAIAAVIVLPPLPEMPWQTALPYIGGLAATGTVAYKTRNTGGAVIIGMVFFGALLWLFS